MTGLFHLPVALREPTLNLSSAYFENPLGFGLVALGLSATVRLVLTLLKCYEVTATANPSHRRFWTFFGRVFIGLGPTQGSSGGEGKGDYLTSALLGLLELLIYPALMAAGLWTYIGAWIGFKTIAQYKHWSDSRSMFNRFLVGNGLVLLFALTILAPLVRFRP